MTLNRPTAESPAASTASPAPAAPVRAVLVATDLVPDGVPSPEHQLACTLPFGHSTFVEACLDSLQEAGVTALDLVVCDHPETLRRLLGDGQRWGMALHWVYVKDRLAPYFSLKPRGNQRQTLLLGHAHQWASSSALRRLLRAPAHALAPSGEWAGWSHVTPEALSNLPPLADRQHLHDWAQRSHHLLHDPLRTDEWAAAHHGPALLQAQFVALSLSSRIDGTALIHPLARMTPPVSIGAGVIVEAGAVLGPGVVLGDRVHVQPGARVQHSVVMSDTLIGPQAHLDGVIAHANRFYDVQGQASAQVPDHMGWLKASSHQATAHAPHALPPARRSGGRALASALALLGSPVAGVLVAAQLLRGRPWGWARTAHVVGKSTQGQWQTTAFRVAHRQSGFTGAVLGWYGALLDVAAGHRVWLGVRPRTQNDWYALRSYWHDILNGQAVGLIHAPCWSETPYRLDSEAIADVYLSVQPSALARWRVWVQAVRGFKLSERMRRARQEASVA